MPLGSSTSTQCSNIIASTSTSCNNGTLARRLREHDINTFTNRLVASVYCAHYSDDDMRCTKEEKEKKLFSFIKNH